MAYVPIEITANVALSGRLMNYIETQYSKAVELIDVHSHDTRYYSRTAVDARFFDVSTPAPEADKIDGLQWNEIIGGMLPIGSVLGWNGTAAEVPDGWHICDGGTYNEMATPDIRGRFILGAGGSYVARSTGGRPSISDCGGTATISGHTLTLDEIPSHYHNWSDIRATSGGSTIYVCYSSGSCAALATTSSVRTTAYNHDAADEAHNHGTKAITLNGFDIMPLYVAKYYICKVS